MESISTIVQYICKYKVKGNKCVVERGTNFEHFTRTLHHNAGIRDQNFAATVA